MFVDYLIIVDCLCSCWLWLLFSLEQILCIFHEVECSAVCHILFQSCALMSNKGRQNLNLTIHTIYCLGTKWNGFDPEWKIWKIILPCATNIFDLSEVISPTSTGSSSSRRVTETFWNWTLWEIRTLYDFVYFDAKVCTFTSVKYWIIYPFSCNGQFLHYSITTFNLRKSLNNSSTTPPP